ncbi:hypothetical protein H072_1652 [Dactylellina haptotyla CBS 200.50]|uniref:Uncharacterized protein n=1 Tax=Dactylellina haptotyla (strain CBS 200.50) TaxID=1284197 RepID=S8ATS5_DACHA|nr:hypothetical protein H072_1652 [Dactylellina haptotyla CBS 200.50]
MSSKDNSSSSQKHKENLRKVSPTNPTRYTHTPPKSQTQELRCSPPKAKSGSARTSPEKAPPPSAPTSDKKKKTAHRNHGFYGSRDVEERPTAGGMPWYEERFYDIAYQRHRPDGPFAEGWDSMQWSESRKKEEGE